MTKEQLKQELEDLQNKMEILENDVDYWQEYANDIAIQKEELEETLKYMVEKTDNVILDLNNFKFKLKINDLLTDDLEKFIENYIRYESEVD